MTIFPDLKQDLITAAQKSLTGDAAIRPTAQPGSAATRRLGWRLPPAVGALLTTAAVGVALAVAVLAVSLGGRHQSGGDVPRGDTPAMTVEQSAEIRLLLAHFAVLRRPQTSADRAWPAGQGAAPLPGTVIPSLTRLARTIDGNRIFLYVNRATRGSKARHLPPEPAALLLGLVDRHNGLASNAVWGPRWDYTITPSPLGPLRRNNSPEMSVSIVPDGIARIRWVLRCAACGTTHTRTIYPTIEGNVAIAPTPARPIALRVTWFAANGRAVVVYNRSNPTQRHPEPFPGARP